MKTILLLHGALGSKDDLAKLQSHLSQNFTVHTLNFYGHGGEPVTHDFSVEDFARQVINWMDDQSLASVNIAGYSMGGYVGLYLASMYPGKVEKLVTVATKLYWDPSIAAKEVQKLDADNIQQNFPALAQELQHKHTFANWRLVLGKTSSMFQHLGNFNPLKFEVFSKIDTPVLLVVGDRDKHVSLVETTTVYSQLPNGSLSILPNTKHGLTSIHTELLALLIQTFITGN